MLRSKPKKGQLVTYQVVKTYPHSLGLSACFRQHRAQSHCSMLHGYSLAIELTFEADELNETNWVIDFGGLKAVKNMLVSTFDHKLLVADDDPQKDVICSLAGLGVADVLVLPNVGCEAFAEYIYEGVNVLLFDLNQVNRPRLVAVKVMEHEGNAAVYRGKPEQE